MGVVSRSPGKVGNGPNPTSSTRHTEPRPPPPPRLSIQSSILPESLAERVELGDSSGRLDPDWDLRVKEVV